MLLMLTDRTMLSRDAVSVLTAVKMIPKGAERAKCKLGPEDDQPKTMHAEHSAFGMQAVSIQYNIRLFRSMILLLVSPEQTITMSGISHRVCKQAHNPCHPLGKSCNNNTTSRAWLTLGS